MHIHSYDMYDGIWIGFIVWIVVSFQPGGGIDAL